MAATRDVLGLSTEQLMMQLGRDFFTFITKYDYNKILRVLGRTFPEFLNALDDLHEHLLFTFPALKSPSFYCEHESKTGTVSLWRRYTSKKFSGLTLHYRSKRRGFQHYVRGQIEFIAKKLYNLDVTTEVLDHEKEGGLEHTIMRLHFANHTYTVRGVRYRVTVDYCIQGDDPVIEDEHRTAMHKQLKINSDVFFEVFPFIVVFNRGMRIRNIGVALLRNMPDMVGEKVRMVQIYEPP